MSDYLNFDDLWDEYQDLIDGEADGELDDADRDRLAEFRRFDAEEFCTIEDLAREEPTGIPEWEFEDYCQDLAEDCGYVDNDSPLRYYVDWEKWARDCKVDYTEVTFDGSTYLVRSW